MLLAAAAAAQPSITMVQNNSSYIVPGMPNWAIAQGSIMFIKGSNLGPSTLVQNSYPLQTSLSGVTITVTPATGPDIQAIPYYVWSQQLTAILPSSTPVGNGKVKVTYNGQTSAAADIKVVTAAFGIGGATGTAVAQNYSHNYPSAVTVQDALNPGETLILWGTGLGPVSGDETVYPSPAAGHNTGTPITVYVGGKQATVTYYGRSAYPADDQINLIIPQGVSGCFVPIMVQTGSYVSNTATIPVAASGRTCSDTTTGVSASDLQSFLGNPNVKTGVISISKSTTTTPGITVGGITVGGGTTTTDSADASFLQFNGAYLTTAASLFQQASIGGCLVFSFDASSMDFAKQLGTVKFLDAGNITMGLPDGSTRTMTKDVTTDPTTGTIISYSVTGGGSGSSATPTFIPNTGGHFIFTGGGGPDVQGFQTSTDVPAALNWSNMTTLGSTINVNSPLTVQWTGGNPNGYVVISGSSTQLSPMLIAMFTCTAPTSAGQFTVPSAVLLSLPLTQATQGVMIPTGSLALESFTTPQKFTAPGIDLGFINSYSSVGESVSWVSQ